MESAKSPLRYKLVLGKFPVKQVKKTATGFTFLLALPGVNLLLDTTIHADVREGDLLTLYTEILGHASPQPASKQ